MAATKITITLPDSQLEEIQKRVRAKSAKRISAWVQRAVEKTLENEADFRAMIDEMLEESGGPATPEELAWARKMLSGGKRRRKSRRAA